MSTSMSIQYTPIFSIKESFSRSGRFSYYKAITKSRALGGKPYYASNRK